MGLWLLPVLLSIFGGSKAAKEVDGGKAGGDDESPRNSAVKPAKPGDVELAKMNNVNKMLDAQKVEAISEGNKEGPDSESKKGPDSES